MNREERIQSIIEESLQSGPDVWWEGEDDGGGSGQEGLC